LNKEGMIVDMAARLRKAGCVFAEDEAYMLVSEAQSLSDLAEMVDKRVSGVPIEYIVGWAQFMGLRIKVEPGVFVPRRRTEFLIQEAIALSSPGSAVIDLCCGSGALGAAFAESVEGVDLHAADIDPVAVRCARQNISSYGGKIYEGDLFDPLPDRLKGRVQTLLANTPYVPTGEVDLLPREARIHESRAALDGGIDGIDIQRKVASEAVSWLAPEGRLWVEASVQQAPQVKDAFANVGLVPDVKRSEELDVAVVIGTKEN